MNIAPPRHPGEMYDSRSGSALITVMIIAMTVLITAGGIHTASISMPMRVRRQTDMIRAKAIAEAGINHGYVTLRNGFAVGLQLLPLGTNVIGGRYDVEAHTDGLEPNEARLLSTGRFGSAVAQVGAEVRNAALDGAGNVGGADPLSPFGQSIFANGKLRFNGTPKRITGSLFTNQEFTLNGQYTNVDALIYARTYNSPPPEANQGVWAERRFPQLDDPDFAAFIADAQAAGKLTQFNGNTTFPQNHVYNGVVVVRGNLTHNGSGTRTVNGLLYVTGNVTFNGSSSIIVKGAFLAGGNVTFNGASSSHADFAYDPTHLPVEPETPAPADHVVIDAWWD